MSTRSPDWILETKCDTRKALGHSIQNFLRVALPLFIKNGNKMFKQLLMQNAPYNIMVKREHFHYFLLSNNSNLYADVAIKYRCLPHLNMNYSYGQIRV